MKDLILISLKAHKEWVPTQIKSDKDRQYYIDMMDYIERVVQAMDNYFGPMIVLEQSFSDLKEHVICLNKELKYKRLAIKHASEVIISISRRFGSGK